MKGFERMTLDNVPSGTFAAVKDAVEVCDNRARFALTSLMAAADGRPLAGNEIYELYFALSTALERLEIAMEMLKTRKTEAADVDG